MIKNESIENLKNQIDIIDIISQYIEIKKTGSNFKACCPFHEESTPSFVISPSKQIYHCFGCQASGDAIKFVMEYEKLSYPESLEKIASIYNFTLEKENTTNNLLDQKILENLNEFYKKIYVNYKNAKDYLKSRGISEFSIEKFEIGYAPSSKDTINYLNSNHFDLNMAIQLGVIDKGDNGLYSRFIERIIFPIYSINSKIVGFGGRTISGHGAKYINSPQTVLFNKSKLLYGYNLAKEKIYKAKQIIICEGYLDVIMLHQVGFNNAVATLGTALTESHLPVLRRGEPKVILAYDGDSAGLNAAFKASLLLGKGDFEGGVVIFSENQDPADMVQNGKIEELNKIFSLPKDFISFAIDYIISKYNIAQPIQKQKALNESNEFLLTLSELNQEEYKRYIAQKLNIRENLIKTISSKQRKNQFDLSKIDIAELCIIKSILQKPSRLNFVIDVIDSSMFNYHKEEFDLLTNNINDSSLNSIILNERLEDYDDERLKKELLILLYKFYENKLSSILHNEKFEFNKKANLIKKIKDNMYQLKRGKLVNYNL